MHHWSARDLSKRFSCGEVSAQEVAKYYLDRVSSLDEKVGAFLSAFPERVMLRAKALDERRARGEKVGKLAAVPVALKDNLHLEGEVTSCASRFLTNYRAPFSATVTRLLEEEGALILGKTNLDEFAMGTTCENSALKKTANPWDLGCVPGGSSGGSAAAVGARLSPVALGSDTGGSIRFPAALCGVVGFKPTYGRVSRYGLVAFGSSLDQVGPMTTTVEDAAWVMEVIGQPCDRDATSHREVPEKYTERLGRSVEGMRVGVPWECLKDLDPVVRENFEASLKSCERLGMQLVDISLESIAHSVSVYYILATAEASTNLARFDGIRYGVRSSEAQTLDEVYDFSKRDGFGREVKRRIMLGTYVLSAGHKGEYYHKALKVRRLMMHEFDAAFSLCDVIAMPASPVAAFATGAIKDPLQLYLLDIFTIPANMAGLPAISVPSGMTKEGKPMGLQLMGPQMADGRVLQVAHAFEKAHDYVRIPAIFQ